MNPGRNELLSFVGLVSLRQDTKLISRCSWRISGRTIEHLFNSGDKDCWRRVGTAELIINN